MERYTLDEVRGDIAYEVDGYHLILHLRPSVFAGLSGDGRYVIGENDNTEPTDNNLFSAKRVLKEIGNGGLLNIIKSNDATIPSDYNVFSALRTLQEIKKNNAYLDDLFLRKDIDDTAHGNITFELSIHSKDFIEGFDTGRGWMISKEGDADLNSADVRYNLVVGNRSGSPKFISGFPNGIGWDLAPYQRINAADVAETKWRLEIDDINVRGQMRVYEFVISQLRGENDNVIFAGMMRVLKADPENEIIYLDTEKGVLYNPFRAGDILMVQRFGGMPSAENGYNVIKQYELRVKEAYVGSLSDGEERVDWIKVEKFVGNWEDVAERDVLTRVDSLTDSTRKGIVKVTTVDEIGAPYIDVVYGMKTNPETATKVRMGNLSGVRTVNNRDLTGVWGLYAEGAVLENSTYYMQNGQTVEQNFTVLNGKLESEISSVKNDMSLEAGNILKNSSFGSNMRYWESTDEVYFIYTADGYIFADEYYTEKKRIADIVSDKGRYVLRLRNNTITQRNAEMRLEGVDFDGNKETAEDGTETVIFPQFSFALYYRPLTDGTLKVGFNGKGLYTEEQLTASDTYKQLSKYAEWDGKGDFMISYTGEILIYGVSLFNDKLADAKIYLEGRITQTAEALTVDYKKLIVDSENTITKAYTGLVKQTAESLTSKYDEILYEKDEEGNVTETLRYDSLISQTASEITTELHKAIYTDDTNQTTKWDAKISATASSLTSKYDAILYQKDEDGKLTNTLRYDSLISQNATNISLKVSSSDYTGTNIVNMINLDTTTATISADRINLVGKVTFNMLAPGVASDTKDENGNPVKSLLALRTDLPDLSNYASKDDIPDVSDYITKETVIAGGLVATDFVLSNGAQIGGFKIDSNQITSKDSSNKQLMAINPLGGIYFTTADIKRQANFGIVSVDPLSGISALSFLGQYKTDEIGQCGMIIRCDSNYGTRNLLLTYSTEGSYRECSIGFRNYAGDDSWFKRLCMNVTSMPFENHLKNTSGIGSPKGHAVYWDENSGLFYVVP